MTDLHPLSFFDLKSFAYADIFDGCSYAWEALTKISAYLKKQKLGKIEIDIPEGAYLINPELISIGKGSVVEPGAYIKGPCLIGENCTVRHGAYIRGDFIAGDKCVIGHDTEVKNAIMLNEAHAAHFAYLGDSILGNQVNLGAGTKCANLKLNRGSIVIHDGISRINTGLRKFGAIIGDASQIGCNAVTNPGTLIGKNVLCHPCLNIGGIIPANSEVKASSKAIICQKASL